MFFFFSKKIKIIINKLKIKPFSCESSYEIVWMSCYGKCPNISYTKVSVKMAYANSGGSGQTAPTLFPITLSMLRNNCKKKKDKILWNKAFEIIGYLPYFICCK